MRFWLLCGWGLLSLTLVGCDTDQIRIVPVTPPGAVIPRPVPQGDEAAEARGESIGTVARGNAGGEAASLATPTPVGEPVTLDNGLTYVTVKEGTGEELKPDRVGILSFEGTLDDGTVFDGNKKLGKPTEFLFGTSRLLKAWELGVPGMKVGEIRKLTVPPALGYKDQDHGSIPANSTLHFELELLGVK